MNGHFQTVGSKRELLLVKSFILSIEVLQIMEAIMSFSRADDKVPAMRFPAMKLLALWEKRHKRLHRLSMSCWYPLVSIVLGGVTENLFLHLGSTTGQWAGAVRTTGVDYP